MKILKYIFSVLVFMFLINFQGLAQTTAQTTSAQAAPPKLSINIFAELSVADSGRAVQIFADYSDSVGGFYIRKTNNSISLRLPASEGAVGKIENILKENGTLIRYNINTNDIGNEYLVLQRQLDSRRRLLSEYNRLMTSAAFSSTLTLERELMTVIAEMENLQGRINRMDNEYRFLRLDINFFSEEARRPPVARRSSFDWINRINFFNFVGGHYAE
ncbi:MAG: DUF4349 domain-containing protein [Spirochaetaceae bacterium]|nr:DUF4349 domain-containing protein [Spirochaetaceae bacterium]